MYKISFFLSVMFNTVLRQTPV